MPKPRQPEPEPEVSQEAVDALRQARTMEEWLAVAEEWGIDWDSLSDDWLEAIVSGDVGSMARRGRERRKPAGGG